MQVLRCLPGETNSWPIPVFVCLVLGAFTDHAADFPVDQNGRHKENRAGFPPPSFTFQALFSPLGLLPAA